LGSLVLCKAGWTSHYISKGEDLTPISFDIGRTPISYTLGTLGMPGYRKETLFQFKNKNDSVLIYLFFLIKEQLLGLVLKDASQNRVRLCLCQELLVQ
jgi:hypothetical protein